MISIFTNKHKNKVGKHLDHILQPVTPDDLFEQNEALIKRLKLAYSDSDSWDDYLLPCLKQLAFAVVTYLIRPTGSFLKRTAFSKPVFLLPLMPSR